MTTIRDTSRYLARAVENYRGDCAVGFPDVYAAKQALWRIAVSVYEIAGDPAPWISQLADIAAGCLKPGQIDSTVRSAARKAGRRGLRGRGGRFLRRGRGRP